MFEMWGLVVAVLLGVASGTITGLIPGLHTNTVAILALAVSGIIGQKVGVIVISIFLIAMIVTHSFVDYIPSIFLGAPDASTALSVLPGHKLLFSGLGFEALKLTVIGGISAFLITLISLPVLVILVNFVEPYLKTLAAPVLLILTIHFILSELEYKKIFWGLIIFLLSGILGIIVLNGLPITQPLFPLLSGIFGVSILLLSLNTKTSIPQQNISYETKLSLSNLSNGGKALLAGGAMGLIPTLGPSQAAVLAQGLSGFKKPEQFLMILGGINTVDTLFTLTTLYVIGKARSGVLVVVQQLLDISFKEYLILVVGAFSALGLAVYITIKLGRGLANRVDKIPYSKISFGIIILITAMVIAFSGFLGLFVLLISTAIGMLSQLSGVRKIHAMGVLSLPVILSYTL